MLAGNPAGRRQSTPQRPPLVLNPTMPQDPLALLCIEPRFPGKLGASVVQLIDYYFPDQPPGIRAAPADAARPTP